MFKIEPIDAYLVNLSDGKGDRLLTKAQVQDLIDDRFGKIVDALPIEGPDKLKAFDILKRNSQYLASTYDLEMVFERAISEHLRDYSNE